jgi:hypothetical protein
VLYVGLAGGSVRARVRQYHSTPLGAKRPHAGGWWLRTLSVLDQLWVHWGETPDYESAEHKMLAAFAAGVPAVTRAALHDSDRVAPFANLRTHSGAIKAHGIVGATGDVPGSRAASAAPRRSAALGRASTPSRPEGTSSASHSRASSQRVTAKDLEAGRVRLPRAAKRLLPSQRTYETVLVRGQELRARWDPRSAPDQERSGVLAFGKGALDEIVAIDEVLTVRRLGDGRFGLE